MVLCILRPRACSLLNSNTHARQYQTAASWMRPCNYEDYTKVNTIGGWGHEALVTEAG